MVTDVIKDIKVYVILKTYPGLPKEFSVGNFIYEYVLIEEYKTDSGYPVVARDSHYRKMFHNYNASSIPVNDVENNPEYFRKIEELEILGKY